MLSLDLKPRFRLITLSLLLPTQLFAQKSDTITAEKIRLVETSLIGPTHNENARKWTITERMLHYKINGLSIAVIKDHKIAWAKGYGLADKTLKQPVTVTTLFQAGSISKSVNAIGIFRLAQEGKINLYKNINEYLTTWKFPYNAASKNTKISIAHLLSHTAGINVPGFSGYEKGQPIPSIYQILDGIKPANSPAVRSVFKPGLKYEYSGGGTLISQLIVTDVTHKSYNDFMRQKVLMPLGMSKSTFLSMPDNASTATGYYDNGKAINGKYHIYPELAAAGLWSTPTEIAKFIIALQQVYNGKLNNGILNKQSAKVMLTPYKNTTAALGVFIDDFEGETYFEHDGLTHGFYSQYYGSLNGGNGLVIMINSVNSGIVPEIVNSIAQVYNFRGLYRSRLNKNLKISESVLNTYVGKYKLAPDVVLNIFKKGNKLYLKATGEEAAPILAESENKFYMGAVDAQIKFIKNRKGKVYELVLYQNGSTAKAIKID